MRKGRIIVVDDEENIRGTLQEILTDEGYQVSCAADGETALRMIQSEAPDLVLLDIWIPGIDGIQTLKILKKIDADTEVVMMSGHGAIETAVKATKFGAFDFIEKPFSLDTILRTVALALKSRRTRIEAKRIYSSSFNGLAVERQFIGSSKAAKEIRRLMRKTAKNDSPALIVGEPGLGKKFVARLIHNLSPRRDKPFIEISCESLVENGFDTTLLGAGDENRLTKFELADGGSIFFDRVDSLPPDLRERLFEILEKKSFKPTGGKREIEINSGIMVSADAWHCGEEGDDDDRFEKVFGAVLKMVPLRERKGDIPEYVEQFVDEYCDEFGKHIEKIDRKVMKAIASHPLPGNVAHLKSLVEQAVLACDGPVLLKDHLPPMTVSAPEEKAADSKDKKKVDKQAELPLPSTNSEKLAVQKLGGARQRTLKTSVVLCGQGLHSGIKTGLILSPLPPDSGIIFGDISTGARVPALLENVRSTEYATTLSNGHVTIKTIEHIMSAMHSYRITNALIKIGDEAPIMDGSALDFCQLIENSGIQEQNAYLEEIVITKPISVGDPDEGPYLSVEPADNFSIHYYLDYPAPIGRQEYEYVYDTAENYKENIAPARTFGFLKDIKSLEKAGLASGGKLSNFVLIDDEKVVNTPLRFPDEPARHKILDLIGDLYLLGRPIRGKFIAKKSGHTQNIALIEKISEQMKNKNKTKTERRHAVGK